MKEVCTGEGGSVKDTISNLKAAAEGDQARIALAQAEIAFALDRKEDTSVLTTLLSEGNCRSGSRTTIPS